MRDKLVILLNANDLQASTWVTLTQTGLVSDAAICTADALSSAQIGREIIVLVPAEEVLLLKVAMPVMPRAKLLQALPFALEDQIIADLDTQHAVPADEIIDGKVTAAVVAHAKMQLWLDQLKSWGVQADRLLPVSALLPEEDKTWEAVVQQVSSAADYHVAELAHELVYDKGPNLLQGRYAPKKNRFKKTKKSAALIGALAAVWLVLLLAYPVVSYFILQQRVNAIQTQIAAIYHRQFPNASSVVAPKLRMEEKLHQITSQLGSNKFLLLSAYVGKGMQAAQGVTLKRLQFQGNRLTLEVSADSVAGFSAFTAYLSGQGLSVKQQNANIAGTRVSAIVEVE